MERFSANGGSWNCLPDIFHMWVMVTLTVCCIIITALSFSQHVETVFPQIFYFPILYATYFYTWRGIIVAGVCAVVYESLAYIYLPPNAFSLGSTALQVILFISVAVVVAYFIEKLRISETRYRRIFDDALRGAIIFDKNNFAIRLANTRFATLLGYTADELSKVNFSTLFQNPDEQHRFFTVLGSGENITNFRTVLMTKTGDACHVTLSWSMIDKNSVSCSAVDVSDCQFIPPVAEDAYTRYEPVYENSPIGIVLLKDRKIQYANPAFSAFSGYKPDEIIGTELSSLIDTGAREKFHAFLNPPDTKTPPAPVSEFGVISKSGETKIGLFFFTPIIQGEHPVALINIVDNTEREKSKGSIPQSNEHEHYMIKILAQELRSPLQPLMGYLTLLIQDPKTYGITDETCQILMRCVKSVDQERHLINRMLELSALETGETPLKYSEFFVLDLIRMIIDIGGYVNKAEISIAVPPDLKFEVDVQKISMVFDAMIANAVTYSKPPKKVWITYLVAPMHPYHEIEIQDNGFGLTDAQIDEMFNPVQSENESKQTQQHDLGSCSLSIAKKYIRMHGGYIHVDSIKNIGSTFTIRLPKQKPVGGKPF